MPVRVFLAEDNDDLATLLTRRMAQREWTVVRARTADEAASRLRGDRFDAVVLDYVLPDGDGLDLLSVVRESSPETPVLFLTAHGSEDVALKALGLGASDYMQKSGSMLDELPDRLAALLTREDQDRSVSRVVTVKEARPEPPQPIAPERARRLVEDMVKGEVLGAALFDGAGAPIAALLPPPLDANILGASLFQVHAQVGVVGRLNRLAPLRYEFTIETEMGTLASTTVNGRAIATILVKRDTMSAAERLAALAALVRG